MSSTTYANQQAVVAAAARPCNGLDRGRGTSWNASVAMAVGSHLEFMECTPIITTKRPARHLGGQPT